MADPEDTKRYTARPEAQPIPWEELTEDQQEAARRACEILGDLAEKALEPDENRSELDVFLPRIDLERHNHVVLIDGGRGSGKTALLVTLLHAWSNSVRARARGGHKKKLPGEVPFDNHLLEKTRRVVPVGMVDLQPLPEATNLLVHLVGQLRRVVEAIERSETKRGAPPRKAAPWHAEEDNDKAPLSAAWRLFLESAVQWDTSEKERRGKLDLEAYALEAEQVEEKRRDVITSFREFGDLLAKEYSRWQGLGEGEPPLFVVPIDDADMNPKRALELLDLVRTLWHPRFAFLLTGDTELFMDVIRNDLAKHVGKRAGELARDIYDKVVPRRHRCLLEKLRYNERLKDPLGTVLERFDAPQYSRRFARSLRDYFEVQSQACEVLPERLRGFLDASGRLQAILPRGMTPTQRAASAEPLALLCAPYHGDDAFRRHDVVRPEHLLREQLEAHADVTWAPRLDGSVEVAVGAQWRFIYQREFRFGAHSDGGKELPYDLATALGVAIDDQGLPPLRPYRLGLRGFGVRVAFSSSSNGWVSFAWPLPDWTSLFDYAAVLYCFNRALTALAARMGVEYGALIREHVSDVARAFLTVVMGYIEATEMGNRDSQEPAAARLKQIGDQVPLSWPQLAKKCAEFDDSGRGIGPGARWSRARAGLLAAPESGLPSDAANEWLRALKGALGQFRAWGGITESLWSEQRVRATIALGLDPDAAGDSAHKTTSRALLSEVHRVAGLHHVWEDEIKAPASVDNFFSDLGKALGPRRVPGSGSTYLTPHRLVTMRGVSAKTLHAWSSVLGRYKDVLGAAQLIVAGLWREAVAYREAAELPSVPQMHTSSLEVVLDLVSRGSRTAKGSHWIFYDAGPSKTVGSRLAVRESRGGWSDSRLNSLLSGSILELAWDVAADAEDETGAVSTLLPSWWNAAGVVVEGDGLIPWPAVEWPALVDYHLSARAWNEVVEPVSVQADWDVLETDAASDMIGYCYLDVVRAVAEKRLREGVSVNLRPGLERWSGILDSLREDASRSDRRGARWSRYVQWIGRVPLMAAPESGLSRDVAALILERLPYDKAELKALRVKRLQHIGVPAQKIYDMLRGFDAENPEHPWVKRFGVHSPKLKFPPVKRSPPAR